MTLINNLKGKFISNFKKFKQWFFSKDYSNFKLDTHKFLMDFFKLFIFLCIFLFEYINIISLNVIIKNYINLGSLFLLISLYYLIYFAKPVFKVSRELLFKISKGYKLILLLLLSILSVFLVIYSGIFIKFINMIFSYIDLYKFNLIKYDSLFNKFKLLNQNTVGILFIFLTIFLNKRRSYNKHYHSKSHKFTFNFLRLPKNTFGKLILLLLPIFMIFSTTIPFKDMGIMGKMSLYQMNSWCISGFDALLPNCGLITFANYSLIIGGIIIGYFIIKSFY